jgi:hypothetical protein
VWREVGSGFHVGPDRVFDLADVADAHAYIESEKNAGRVVLQIS